MAANQNMLEYNSDYSIKPFGMHNSGTLCWFNALMQSMMSLTCVNESIMIKYKNKDYSSENNLLLLKYLYLFCVAKNKQLTNDFLNDVFKTLMKTINTKQKYVGLLSSHLQCSASEGFIILLDLLNCTYIESLFKNRINHNIICTTCKKLIPLRSDESCQIEIFENISFNSAKEFSEYLLEHVSTVDSYKCESCNVTGNYQKYSNLSMLNNIIVLLFNKYGNRRLQWFPPNLSFKKTNNLFLNYDLMASIEHFGNISSGHYIAHVKRDGKYYTCNDESIIPISSIKPSDNTYMVFYQLITDNATSAVNDNATFSINDTTAVNANIDIT